MHQERSQMWRWCTSDCWTAKDYLPAWRWQVMRKSRWTYSTSWKGLWMKDVRAERWAWSDRNTRTRCWASSASWCSRWMRKKDFRTADMQDLSWSFMAAIWRSFSRVVASICCISLRFLLPSVWGPFMSLLQCGTHGQMTVKSAWSSLAWPAYLWFRGLRLIQVSMPPIWQGTALQGPLVLRHPGDGGLLCWAGESQSGGGSYAQQPSTQVWQLHEHTGMLQSRDPQWGAGRNQTPLCFDSGGLARNAAEAEEDVGIHTQTQAGVTRISWLLIKLKSSFVPDIVS